MLRFFVAQSDFFFFKQKTAYEMRISDWSSDVCSSDLFDLGATSNAVTVEHEKGFDVDGIIGYDFGGFRAEFEVGYKDANLDSVSTSVAGVPGGGGTSYQIGRAHV